MSLAIIKNPNPILRQTAQVVSKEELSKNNFQKTLAEMITTMLEKDGVGLAAPQVGISKRIVVVNTKEGPLVLINPEILKFGWKKETEEEGCLSVTDTWGKVSRSYRIKVKALSHEGQEINFSAVGLFARIIQHEMDHLNGVLFIDKAKNIYYEKKI